VNIREIVGLAPVIPVLTITELEHAVPLARALAGFKLPPEIALQPGEPAFRAGDHELMSTVFAGEVHHGRAELDVRNYCRLGIETEIAVRLGEDLRILFGTFFNISHRLTETKSTFIHAPEK